MAINIKELFVTDLDPNSGAWWSVDKVDKINYNFNQFLNGGAPGPQGTIGVDGGFGQTGPQGDTGYKGSQGFQGYQGSGIFNEWEYFPEGDGLPGYLSPRKNTIGVNQSAPVALRIGFQGNDTGVYNVGSAQQATPIQIVKARDSWVNLRVEDNGGFNGYNFGFDIDCGCPGDAHFKISPGLAGTEFRIIYTAENIVLKTGDTHTSLIDSITITNSEITVNTGGNSGVPFFLGEPSGKTTKSKDAFIFTTGAIKDRVLVSNNTNGNVEWKDAKKVFGTFPIGSIISIRPDEFNTDHFWLNDSVDVASGSLLNNIYGRGKIGTDFERWYLCNGETWETEEGFNQYLTPDLNNFSYTISANGGAQSLVTAPELDPIVIGGYDLTMYANTDIDGLYKIEFTTRILDNDTSPGNNTISMPISGSTHTVSSMIHIVYLENPNLKWSVGGSSTPPVTVNTITLTEPGATDALTCNLPLTSYYDWNGPDATTWNTFEVSSSVYKLFNLNTTIYAPSGWYTNIYGYPIYWSSSIGKFTQRGTLCTT